VVTSGDIKRFVDAYAASIEQRTEELTELDSAIGDADHGTNMKRGMLAAVERVAPLDGSPAEILKGTATALISKVGGASGPLYGTAFLRAADAVAGKESLDDTDVVALFGAMLTGVQQRGHAQVGEKTMVDALSPAVDALRAAIERGASLETALDEARAAAHTGSDATIPLIAQKGRASYLGERSRGHRDPGSFSTALLFDAAAETLG
jgi:phosphoenolpyruvate---glycerone phosphotransferase subunit DhaL